MKGRWMVACVGALLVGCAAPAPVAWYKDGASDEQFRRDHLTCRQYGMQSAAANGLNGNLFVESWIQEEASKCLVGLGYTTQRNRAPAARAEPVSAGDKCPDSFPSCSWGR